MNINAHIYALKSVEIVSKNALQKEQGFTVVHSTNFEFVIVSYECW